MMKNNSKPGHEFPGDNNAMDGETVNDIYLFNPGCGQDSIDDTADIDILRIDAGVLPADITFTRSGMDLVLCINGKDDRLILKNWGGSRSARINRIEFADGTVWHAACLQSQITAVITGTTGDDSQTA